MRPVTDHQRGSKRFVSRIRQIVTEYRKRGLGPSGAWAEVPAALREMDRRNEGDKDQWRRT